MCVISLSSAQADHWSVSVPGRCFVGTPLRMQLKQEDLMGICESRIDFIGQRLVAIGEVHNDTAQNRQFNFVDYKIYCNRIR